MVEHVAQWDDPDRVVCVDDEGSGGDERVGAEEGEEGIGYRGMGGEEGEDGVEVFPKLVLCEVSVRCAECIWVSLGS